jgi:hypothetical protein
VNEVVRVPLQSSGTNAWCLPADDDPTKVPMEGGRGGTCNQREKKRFVLLFRTGGGGEEGEGAAQVADHTYVLPLCGQAHPLTRFRSDG